MLRQAHIAEFFDAAGNRISLGRRLGEGGEGAVYEVQGRHEVVAKIYHQGIGAAKAAKLELMARGKSEKLLQLSSWPMETLYRQPGGDMLGILMPRISGYKPIHELYSPRSRRAEFPQANWPFLVHAAANVARAFAVMHEHGHIIGDVNHGNIVVSSNALVKLIDCDSFQVRGQQNDIFYCEVGVPEYTPPELHGRDFSKTLRTPNHDAFGLSVLIFHLLFMGRHPFAGRYTGADYMPIERAIREFRFVYGKEGPLRQMQPPPNTLPLEFVSAPVAQLFERAFSKSSLDTNSRPKAEEWVSALGKLAAELKTCSRSEAHAFYGGLPSCPWCELERKLGVDLFIITRTMGAHAPFDISAIWTRITAIEAPGVASMPAATILAASPSAKARRDRFWYNIGAPLLGGLVVLALVAATYFMASATLPWAVGLGLLIAIFYTRRGYVETYRRAESEAAAKLQTLEQEWEKTASDKVFKKAFRELEKARQEYIQLPQYRAQEHARVKTQLKELQLERFLEGLRIKDGRIEGIGRERIAMLLSYGIETAADLQKARLKKVPGFGKVLVKRLLDWRTEQEKYFVFDPYKGVDPRDIAKVDRQVNEKRNQLEATLSAGPLKLVQIRDEILMARQRLQSKLEEAQSALAQAKADWLYVS